LSLYDHDGTFLTDGNPPREAWHIDSLFIYDIRPDLPGLEAVLLEEGPSHVVLLGAKGRIWRIHHQQQELQNAAVGEDVCIFDPMTGKIIERFRDQAARLYVADVAGDLARGIDRGQWREERSAYLWEFQTQSQTEASTPVEAEPLSS